MIADDFREAMDNDKAFQSKRRALIFVSLLLLALVVSGAQIKEANTFIFKIDFTNHEGLRYLLVFSVLACALRYYSYSERYHNNLFSLWSSRLLSDRYIYFVDEEGGVISGLLGKKVDIYPGDNYDVENPVYLKSGFFKRKVGFKTSSPHDFYGEVYYKHYFDLNEYDSGWSSRDYRKLMVFELKYRVQAWFKYRETLDLVSPYVLAISAMIAFLVSTIFAPSS